MPLSLPFVEPWHVFHYVFDECNVQQQLLFDIIFWNKLLTKTVNIFGASFLNVQYMIYLNIYSNYKEDLNSLNRSIWSIQGQGVL